MNNLLFIIFLLSLPVIAFFIIRAILAFIKKDKTQGIKQLKFSVVSGVVMMVSLIAFVATADPIDETNEVATEDIAEESEVKVDPVAEEQKKEEVTPVKIEKPKEIPVVEKSETEEVPAIKEEPAKDSVWDDMKDEAEIVGKSDKNFKEITKSKPNKVRNDTTGKAKKLVTSGNEDVLEYLLSYEKRNMKDDEVHYIINFTNNTTTIVNKMSGLLYADVKEYVSKEEHDAKKIGSGMFLKSYIIYPDGDIEDIK